MLLPLTPLTSMASVPLPVWIKTFGISAAMLMLSEVARIRSCVMPLTGPVYGSPPNGTVSPVVWLLIRKSPGGGGGGGVSATAVVLSDCVCPASDKSSLNLVVTDDWPLGRAAGVKVSASSSVVIVAGSAAARG